MSPRDLIRKTLSDVYPSGMLSAEIRSALNGQLDQKQVSNNLYLMKQDCVIEQDGEGHYLLTTAPAVKTPETQEKPSKAPSFADLATKVEASRAMPAVEQAEPAVDYTSIDDRGWLVTDEQTRLMDEISTLNQGIAAAEVLDKRSRPDDLDDLLNNIDTLATGISDNAPVAAAVLNKAMDYLKRGYEL